MNKSHPTRTFDIPEAPWKLIAEQRNIMRKLWNRDQDSFDLKYPVISINWPYSFEVDGVKFDEKKPFNSSSKPELRAKNPEFDLACQLERVKHEIECLEASADVGYVMANTPALDLIHFGTAPLATAFGAKIVHLGDSQPHFDPAVHTPEEVLKLKKPDLFNDGMCPQILERIRYYNEMTQGKVIISPSDSGGVWSIATSIWHYEDMLEAIYTAPEALHYLLNLFTDCLIEWWNIQEAYIGRWGRTHTSFSWPWFQRGVFIGDDTMVTVSPKICEEFFLPYNNRLSREYGNMIFYHCCMKYEHQFESLIKTDGFIGFDATPEYNDFNKIEATLSKCRGVWAQARSPKDIDQIRRLKGKVGMLFTVNGDNRADAVKKTKDFLSQLRSL